MDGKCKCKFCPHYKDREGRCSMSCDHRFQLDEIHDCFFADSSLGEFNSLLKSLEAISNSLENVDGIVGRCVNTEKKDEITDKLNSLRDYAIATIKDIRENPDNYRTIQKCLGTCRDCKHLDSEKSGWYGGHHTYGKCKYAPIAYEGHICEESWRGCAKWEHN